MSSRNIVTQIVPKPFLAFYREHVAAGVPLALVTTLRTEGSTYSKTGKQLLMSRDGRLSGLVSGGCLEGDLLLRAVDAIDTGRSALSFGRQRADSVKRPRAPATAARSSSRPACRRTLA